jgi:hypothetical protein
MFMHSPPEADHLFAMSMADIFFLITKFTHQQTFYFYLTNFINSDSTSLRRPVHRSVHYSSADEERFELSTIGLTSRRSAIELFIQC